MPLVLFDIDGTLVPDRSSEARFAAYLWQQGELGLRQLVAFAWFCARYFPRFGRHVMQKNKAYLSGHDEQHIARLAERFVTDVLIHELDPRVLERLRAHQAAGDTVALLSGTPQFIAEALARALGVRHSIGAACAVCDGRFVTMPPLRHPYGETKIDAAAGLAGAAGLPLDKAIAFGDSISDAYLFRAVGRAVVVAPDRRLSMAAKGAGWEVLRKPVDLS